MFETERKIYNLMADEESKEIFTKRLKYSITEYENFFRFNAEGIIEFKYLKQRIIKKVNEQVVDKFKNEISEIKKLSKNKKVILYGAGDNCIAYIYILEKLNNLKIECLCDKKAEKNFYTFMDHMVIDINSLAKKYKDALIISTIASDEIDSSLVYDELVNVGFEYDKIIKAPFGKIATYLLDG